MVLEEIALKDLKDNTPVEVVVATKALKVAQTGELPAGTQNIGGFEFVDENGVLYGVQQTNNHPIFINFPKGWAISEGLLTDHVHRHILGANNATSSSEEDVWEGSTSDLIVPPPDGGIQMEVVSTSDLDSGSGGVNPASTGVRQVMLHYLDANYEEQSEFITLDGTTPINTVATDILRVQSMHTQSTGSGNKAVGTITLENTNSTIEYTRIRIGLNQSLTCFWTVPAGRMFHITSWDASATATVANRTNEFILCATASHHNTLLKDIFIVKDLIKLTTGSHSENFAIPLIIPEKADVKASVISSGTTETSVMIEGWYE